MTAKSWKAIRTVQTACVVTALVIVLLAAVVEQAMAKGPVSVRLGGPGIEQPLELMDEDNWELVSRLMEQTGLWYATGDLPQRIDEPTGELGPAYTLTWLNMGPPEKSEAERTFHQILYLHAEGGPVIHTPRQETLSGWGGTVFGWFAAPEGLIDTLEALGAPVAAPQTASSNRAPGGDLISSVSPYLAVAGLIIVAVLAGVVGARRLVVMRPGYAERHSTSRSRGPAHHPHQLPE